MHNNQANAVIPREKRKALDKHKFFQLIDCHIFKRRWFHISYSSAVCRWLCLEECKQMAVGGRGSSTKKKVEKYKNNSNNKKHCIREINSEPYEITNAWMITNVLVVVVVVDIVVIVMCIMCSGINTIQKRTILFIYIYAGGNSYIYPANPFPMLLSICCSVSLSCTTCWIHFSIYICTYV